MSKVVELQVNRENYHDTRIIELDESPLVENQVRVEIDKFALTSNNVSYAVSGDVIGYWNYYPAETPYGKVPVWGYARVVESKSDTIKVGERIWGFFPMANQTVLTVGKVFDDNFMDATPSRQELPILYNQYRRTQGEPKFLQNYDDERSLLFPLFMTSFLIYDFLKDNDFFGAKQVLIGSVSSKTGFGLAKLIHNDKEADVKVIGLTSSRNVEFVEKLGCCDDVVVYGDEGRIDRNQNAAYVDMSGNAQLTEKLHNQFGDRLVNSCLVGATHWEERRQVDTQLPGARPTFFFAPAQITKRNKEWGPGVVIQKAMIAAAELSDAIKGDLQIEQVTQADQAADIWRDLLDNKVAPNRGIMVKF